MKHVIVTTLVLLAACNCTANFDATAVDQSGCEQTAETDPSILAKFRARDVVVDDTLQVGATVPEPTTQRVVFSAIDTGTRVMQTITSHGHTGHNSGGGSNQITHLFISADASYDTTTQDGTNRAIEIIAGCSVSSGPGSCEDTAIVANAVNGHSWLSETGIMEQQGAVQFGPGAVSLGSNVSAYSMPGTSGTATQFHIGWATTPGNVFSGVSMAVKNAQPSVTFGGYGVALDTSVSGASGIRGGYIMSRGASGGLGTGLSSGMVLSGGTGFPFTDSAANEMAIYDELGVGIAFGANTSTFGKGFKLTPKDHINYLGTTITPDANCSSGTGAVFNGVDMAGKIKLGSTASACTLPFVNTYTTAPACIVTAEGGVALPNYTISATAITMTTVTAAATYNYWCPGLSGGT